MVDSTFEILTDYHTATVSLLALLSASTENVSFFLQTQGLGLRVDMEG